MLASSRKEFDEVRSVFEKTNSAYEKVKASEGAWQDRVGEFKEVLDSVPPGLYEHFKSSEDTPKIYVVYGVSLDVEDGTPWVVYAPLYNLQKGTMTLRPLLDTKDAFLAPIEREEYMGARFRFLRKANFEELGKIVDTIHTASFTKRSELATRFSF
jgi:hypothetical protein